MNDNIHNYSTTVGAKNYVKKSTKRLKNVRGYVKQFCEFTSIQGPAYIVRNATLLERVWWIFVFIVGITGSWIMVGKILDKYVTTPVLVSLATKEAKIRDIPFPSVTICPKAKVSHECLNYTEILQARKKGNVFDINGEQNVYFDFMSLLCRSDNHAGTMSYMLDYFNISSSEVGNLTKGFYLNDYSEFLKNCSTVKLEEGICKWMGTRVNCQDIMTPILTEKGLCYSFNMYDVRDIYSDLNDMEYYPEGIRRTDWTPDKGYRRKPGESEKFYPRRAILNGAKNAFEAVFFTHRNDITHACDDISTQGMLVTLHTPMSIPRPERVSFSVRLDSLTTAAVKPTFTETSEIVKNYSPKQRFCFFNNERNLKFFKFYSQSNCNFECLVNYTMHRCGCVNFYMPRDNNTGICRLENRVCLQESRKSYGIDVLRERLKMKDDSWGDSACNCLPLCADLTYNYELSQSKWDWNDPDEFEFDAFRKNMSEYQASGLKVYFKNSFFLPSLRNELYGTSDMISNIGGVVNLFIGVSLITCGEIIFFLSFKFIDNHNKYGHWFGKQE